MANTKTCPLGLKSRIDGAEFSMIEWERSTCPKMGTPAKKARCRGYVSNMRSYIRQARAAMPRDCAKALSLLSEAIFYSGAISGMADKKGSR